MCLCLRNYLTPSDLKTILPPKRANIYYLEKCQVQVNGGRWEYVTSEGKESYYWNIPIAGEYHGVDAGNGNFRYPGGDA